MANLISRAAEKLHGAAGVLLTLAALFWAGNAIASRLAVGEISPPTLVLLRWLLVVAVMWPLYGREVRRQWSEVRPRFGGIVVMALMGFTGFNTLFYIAGHHTSAINLGILQGALPVFVMGGAFVAHGSRITLLQATGVLLTILGVLLVATRGVPENILALAFNRGDLLMLAACALYAFYTVALRDRPTMPGAVFFTLLSAIAAVAAVPLVAYEALTSGLSLPTTTGLLVTAYVAIFPSCLAQLFMLRGVDLIGPGRAGVYINLVPVFAALLAVLLLHEPFGIYHALALAMVSFGVLLAQASPRRPHAAR